MNTQTMEPLSSSSSSSAQEAASSLSPKVLEEFKDYESQMASSQKLQGRLVYALRGKSAEDFCVGTRIASKDVFYTVRGKAYKDFIECANKGEFAVMLAGVGPGLENITWKEEEKFATHLVYGIGDQSAIILSRYVTHYVCLSLEDPLPNCNQELLWDLVANPQIQEIWKRQKECVDKDQVTFIDMFVSMISCFRNMERIHPNFEALPPNVKLIPQEVLLDIYDIIATELMKTVPEALADKAQCMLTDPSIETLQAFQQVYAQHAFQTTDEKIRALIVEKRIPTDKAVLVQTNQAHFDAVRKALETKKS